MQRGQRTGLKMVVVAKLNIKVDMEALMREDSKSKL